MRVGRRHAWLVVTALAVGSACVFDPAGSPAVSDDAPGQADAAPGTPDAASPGTIDARPQGQADAAPCPPGWTPSGSSCYLVVTQALTWDEARDACTLSNAHLVIVNDADENARVRALPGGVAWWIGATDAANESHWLWVDGTPADFTAWAILQPDDFLFNEDCAQQSPDGSWNDFVCTSTAPFVCEQDAAR